MGDKVQNDKQLNKKKKKSLQKIEETDTEIQNGEPALGKKQLSNEIERMAMEQMKHEREQNNQQQSGFCACTPLKFAHYLIFYVFTITDMYCRIYPMLLVAAYSYKRAGVLRDAEDGNLGNDSWSVVLAWFSVTGIVWTYEAILYKNILTPGYNEWTTVF